MDKQITQLEQTVQEQIDAQERLLSLLRRKVESFRSADQAKLLECCGLENDQLQRIGELEKRRLMLVAELTQAIEPSAAEPMKMADLAQRLPEPARGRLLVLREQLRRRLETVRREGSIVRRAADALLRHMQGLMQSIGGALTGIGTYGRRGAPPTAAMAVSTFSATA